MTETQERRIRKERRITAISISILFALSAALLVVTLRGDVASSRAVDENIVGRTAAVETIVGDVQKLQECIVQLLLIHPDTRAQLPAEEISALCPPRDAPLPEDTPPAPAPADPAAAAQPAPPGPDPPAAPPHTQPAPQPLPPPMADPRHHHPNPRPALSVTSSTSSVTPPASWHPSPARTPPALVAGGVLLC